MNKGKKVFVGVSGGVDSSVSLALLKDAGYDITGVFLKVWYPDFMPCDWKEERLSAMRVCATLDVPFLTLDCEKEYKQEVVDYMINEYKVGRVPNPDIFCNKYVKFGVFLKKAKEMGADFVATGHYAQNIYSEGVYKLTESKDKDKDQSYFLYTLNQEQLKHILFPVGHLTKPEVRKLAEKYNLPTATKKDSQGLCFMGNIDIKDFLGHFIPQKKGDVIDINGNVIGFHDGIQYLTIGQRHGFTITKKTSEDPKYFIIKKDVSMNTITVAHKEAQSDVINSIKSLKLRDLHIITGEKINFPYKTTVKIRYRQENIDCEIDLVENEYIVRFTNPESGIAEGQSAVFYDGEVCIGGGIISTVE